MIIKEFLETQTALVAIAIDDYNNTIITDQEVCMLIDGEKPDFINEDGYHIFLKLQPGLHNLSAGGWMFQQQDIVIDSDEEKFIGQGVLRIRLQPNCHYFSGENTTVLRGLAEPVSELHFVFINEKEPYRLGENYTAGAAELVMSHQTQSYLDGTLFCLQKADGQLEEFWIEAGTEEKGCFRLRYALNDSYEKEKAILRRVYVVTADQEGRFYFPVPEDAESSGEFRYYKPLLKQELQTGSFIRGRQNYLTAAKEGEGSVEEAEWGWEILYLK